KELTVALASAGLGSPPTWLKPYHVLSGGEKFRAELFRAVIANADCGVRIAESGTNDMSSGCQPRVVVFDEFTALLDRTVAKTTSAALGRLLRSLTPHSEIRIPHLLRLVAVTCHRDILPWLGPDWTVDLGRSDGETERRRDGGTKSSSVCHS